MSILTCLCARTHADTETETDTRHTETQTETGTETDTDMHTVPSNGSGTHSVPRERAHASVKGRWSKLHSARRQSTFGNNREQEYVKIFKSTPEILKN